MQAEKSPAMPGFAVFSPQAMTPVRHRWPVHHRAMSAWPQPPSGAFAQSEIP
jgi:hypothetical protein